MSKAFPNLDQIGTTTVITAEELHSAMLVQLQEWYRSKSR
jgi:hypothetical protein